MGRVLCSAQLAWRHLVVSAAEKVVPEALRDGGSGPQDLGHVLSSDQHVAIVQLDVHVRLFVQKVVGAARRRQADQLPEVAVQLVASGCLSEAKQKLGQLVCVPGKTLTGGEFKIDWKKCATSW